MVQWQKSPQLFFSKATKKEPLCGILCRRKKGRSCQVSFFVLFVCGSITHGLDSRLDGARLNLKTYFRDSLWPQNHFATSRSQEHFFQAMGKRPWVARCFRFWNSMKMELRKHCSEIKCVFFVTWMTSPNTWIDLCIGNNRWNHGVTRNAMNGPAYFASNRIYWKFANRSDSAVINIQHMYIFPFDWDEQKMGITCPCLWCFTTSCAMGLSYRFPIFGAISCSICRWNCVSAISHEKRC